MENFRLGITYAEWVVVILLTLAFFSYFSRKNKTIWKLLPLVLLPVWFIIALITGIENMYFANSSELFSIGGFCYLLAEALPVLLLFGGITFGLKYNKFRKINKS